MLTRLGARTERDMLATEDTVSHYHQFRSLLYFAKFEGSGIVMDLQEDRYYALDEFATLVWEAVESRTELTALAAPVQKELSAGAGAGDRARLLIAEWTRLGLLLASAEGRGAGRAEPMLVAKPLGQTPSRQLTAETWRAGISPLMLCRLLIAHSWAWFALRKGALWALRHVGSTGPSTQTASLPYLVSLSASFSAFRSVYGADRNDCLQRAFTVAKVCRQDGVSCDICFGVQQNPFSAHCWLEVDGMLIGDSLARVERFVPIARF